MKTIVAVDLSGSITPDMRARMIDALSGIKCSEIIGFDTEIRFITSDRAIATAKILNEGRGGSMFQMVDTYCELAGAEKIIILTDGYLFDLVKRPGVTYEIIEIPDWVRSS